MCNRFGAQEAGGKVVSLNIKEVLHDASGQGGTLFRDVSEEDMPQLMGERPAATRRAATVVVKDGILPADQLC